MKRIVSAVIVLALCFTIIPANVFAAEENQSGRADILNNLIEIGISDLNSYSGIPLRKLRKIESYTSLGDSTVFGYGLDGAKSGTASFDNHYGFGIVSKKDADAEDYFGNGSAYPLILAEKLNIKLTPENCPFCGTEKYIDCNAGNNGFAQLSIGSLRAEDILAIISYDSSDLEKYREGIASKSYFKTTIYDYLIPCYVDCRCGKGNLSDEYKQEAFFKMQQIFVDNIKNSDLITLSVGGNNFGNMINFLSSLGDSSECSASEMLDFELEGYIPSARLLDSRMQFLKSMFEKSGLSISEINGMDLETYLKLIIYFYLSVCDNIQKTADEIHRINKDAIIVITGMYNPLDSLEIKIEGIDKGIELGRVLNVILNRINAQIRRYSLAHPYYCVYADISDAEVFLDCIPLEAISLEKLPLELSKILNEDNAKAAHESAGGHKYIAEQIYSALYRKKSYPFIRNGAFGLFR